MNFEASLAQAAQKSDLAAPVPDLRLAMVPALALLMSLAVLVATLASRVQLFADGGYFAFAILTGDPWGAHFANIPARASAYLITILPPLGLARLGYPEAAITLYGGLLGALPAAGLLATSAISGRTRLLLACAISTLVVVPFAVFFPSEMLVTHALFWPLLALVMHPAPKPLLVALLMPAMALSHEGGVVLLVLMMVYLLTSRQTGRAVWLAFALTIAIWLGIKVFVSPTHLATQEVVSRNTLMALNPLGIIRPASVAMALAFGFFLLAFARCRDAAPSLRRLAGLALLALLPVVPVIALSEALLVGRYDAMLVGRYNFRTLILFALSLFLLIITLRALPERSLPRWLARGLAWRPARLRDALFGLMLVAAGCHIIEGGRFLWAWRDFSGQLTSIARGAPAPLPTGYTRLDAGATMPIQRLESPGRAWSTSWTWADPFLSVVLAMPEPARALVYQPQHSYAPLSCRGIKGLTPQSLRLPAQSMALITRYMCEIRPRDERQ